MFNWPASIPLWRRVASSIALLSLVSAFPAGPAKATKLRTISSQKAVGMIEPVAYFDGPMPTGVTVSASGRIFVNFPRWGDKVDFTVAELLNGKAVAYPDAAINSGSEPDHLCSVQSVVVDANDRLWILDTGSPGFAALDGRAKLVCVDLKSNKVIRTIFIPPDVALRNTYLNDVRFDLSRGKNGMAFISDSSSVSNAIIVVDLASGESWRRLNDHVSVKAVPGFMPVVEGQILNGLHVGSDGIAIGADGKRLFYCPLCSRKLYSVSVDALCDRSKTDSEVAETVCEVVTKGASDGLESDAQGRIYASDFEHNAIHRIDLSGRDQTLVCDPRVLWPDTLCLARNGYLYFMANQLHRQPRFHNGVDKREKPYVLFRIKVDGSPVLLK